jgi:predicted CXXCH cytochrome family protein
MTSYPASVLLREACELAARASVELGDDGAGLEWAQRSLRLMPENPFLLAMVADVAARQKRLDLAETSARDALAYLANAEVPVPLTEQQWPGVRDDLRATAYFVLGRVSALRNRFAQAEASLLESLLLRPGDPQTLYVLGLVRIELHDEEGAAGSLAEAARSSGPFQDVAVKSLRTIFTTRPRPDGQTFEQFAASLEWKAPVRPPLAENAAKPHGVYAGSSSCGECHAREYESWRATGMGKMFRPYRPQDVSGDFSSGQIVDGSARPVLDQGRHFIEIRDAATQRWTRYPVDFLIGSKWQQAYATRLPDARYLVFPIQYSRLRSTWLNYWKIVDGADSPRADISKFKTIPAEAVYQNTCAACHTSQLRVPAPAVGIAPVPVFQEGGINCEMCHGPSKSHVDTMKAGTRHVGDALEPPVSFKRLSAEQSTAICAQCHSQSSVHEASPGGAVNYSDDHGSTPFYRTYNAHLPSNFARAAFYRDGRYKATTFISESFRRSECFRKGGATCISCHDPHARDAGESNPTSLKFRNDPNQMCLQCHESLRTQVERHTRHAANSEASQCVSCHMPRIMDALLFAARSHEIDDIPDAAMTARFGPADSPNACLSCHRDRNAAWLMGAVSH